MRKLECCCCGRDAGRWRQWPNRDSGYGICRQCVDSALAAGERPEDVRDCYGVEGTHYAPKPA